MNSRQSNSELEDGSGGLLVLSENGTILRCPPFFRRIMMLDGRAGASTIFHLFDPHHPPYLRLHRIYRHAYGATEYHLRVFDGFGTRHGFRYWPVEHDASSSLGASSFYIVDDSALLRSHDWDLRRLRREILADARDGLSSYFKNRLTTMQLLAETLRDAPEIASELAPRLGNAVDELKGALNRVITGIEDIESPSQYQDSPVRLTDLASVIATWSTPEVEVICSLQEVSPATLVSSANVERIVLPVVENALEASPPGTTVEMAITEVDEGFAHIEIADQGRGMPPRVQQRAQDPFFSTRTGQLGLGLAHAREALRDAGGEWKFESRPRGGTRVTLLLPITTAAQLFG